MSVRFRAVGTPHIRVRVGEVYGCGYAIHPPLASRVSPPTPVPRGGSYHIRGVYRIHMRCANVNARLCPGGIFRMGGDQLHGRGLPSVLQLCCHDC